MKALVGWKRGGEGVKIVVISFKDGPKDTLAKINPCKSRKITLPHHLDPLREEGGGGDAILTPLKIRVIVKIEKSCHIIFI